jgi:toxin CptA
MHNAPSVSYPVGRCRFAAAAAGVLWSLGALVLAGWMAQARIPGWQLAAAWLAWGAAGSAAARSWWCSPRGTFEWTGDAWILEGADHGPPSVALDLQHCMLLRLDRQRTLWLWLERRTRPQHWDALRRAVYSPASTAAPHGAKPPVVHT